MSKAGPPPGAPPSYSQAVGGVPPSAHIYQSPYDQGDPFAQNVYPQGFAPVHTYASAPPIGILTTVVPVGPHTTHMVCPSCQKEIDTKVKTQPGILAYLSSALICLFGCWLGCCLIPCCIEDCMDVSHHCPHCDAYLGRFKRG